MEQGRFAELLAALRSLAEACEAFRLGLGYFEANWHPIWRQIKTSIRSEVSAALHKKGIEPTESKIRHASHFILPRIKEDQRFQRRLRCHHESARLAGCYAP